MESSSGGNTAGHCASHLTVAATPQRIATSRRRWLSAPGSALPAFMSRLNFTLEREASGSRARAARYQTLHGPVQTPIFMPVGTQATVKGQTIHTLKAT